MNPKSYHYSYRDITQCLKVSDSTFVNLEFTLLRDLKLRQMAIKFLMVSSGCSFKVSQGYEISNLTISTTYSKTICSY